jgi:hypothetical protein
MKAFIKLQWAEWFCVIWEPIITAWHVLGLRMEEMAFRYGG